MPHERILVADDDPLVAEEVQRNLLSLGYCIEGPAASGSEAVCMARNTRPDLVFMDINMPGAMDGIHAAEQIKPLHIPVVYVTGFCDGPLLERAKRTEPSGFIQKPFHPGGIKPVVEFALQRSETERNKGADCKTGACGHRITGMLPICSYCKKIKEPDNRWTQIEAYIMRRTDASFTHGMCPQCFENMKRQLEALESGAAKASLIIG